MALSLIAPASEPVVSLASAKAWCKVEGNANDLVLGELVLAAQRHIEQIIERSLGEQTWRLTLDAFSDAIELPKGPVTGIVTNSFTYRDVAGLQQIVDPALYSLDLVSNPAWVVRNSDASWPALLDGVNAVAIEFTAGEGAALCPPDLARAILLLTAFWFDNREAVNVGNIINEVPFGVRSLTDPYRKIRI